MARSPSARALSNVVDLYRFTAVQDIDAGLAAGPYGAAFATAVPCSVQATAPMRFLDDTTGRIIEKTPYVVYFATNYALKASDKLVWTDDTGTTRILFVFGTVNEAGKGGAFSVTCEERL